ncbi:acyl carrier protein [Acetobacterium bakii]|uniref:Acyl carrier protein n=1 Tax=Acetobacterium bakii TaxID=52689 RepID=A0A0L6TZ25_9FIRM|nr:acyl carrier protein [Acetobacterium bakii]KNZ41521.1 acyl carrier protein [Acetobacterium bakii]
MDEKLLKVREIIAEQLDLDLDDITLETSLVEDLKADSLDIVELIMAFEDEFEIKIDDEVLENILTVQDIINAIA